MIEAWAADENYIYYLYFRIALIIYHLWILLSLERDFPGRSQIGPPPILPLSSSPFFHFNGKASHIFFPLNQTCWRQKKSHAWFRY